MTLKITLGLVLVIFAWVTPASADNTETKGAISANIGHQWGHIVSQNWPQVRAFYAERGDEGLWVRNGKATKMAHEIIEILASSGSQGLDPKHYNIDILRAAIELSPTPKSFEQQLTGELLHYVSELQFGRLSSDALAASDSISETEFDAKSILTSLVNSQDTASIFLSLAPANSEYRSLRIALRVYQDAARNRDWVQIPTGSIIKPGMTDERLPLIRQRLIATKGTKQLTRDDDIHLYDDATAIAVASFQRQFGLEPDGIIGKNTLAEMNISAEARAEQINLNMERWRRFTHEPDSVQIIVNLAGFDLRVLEDGVVVMEMPVAVGRPFRRTPIFNGLITYLEFSPTWTVPPTILKEDILPKLRNDPTYLSTKGIEVYSGWNADSHKLVPENVDWAAISNQALSYRFVQPPGPTNALGRVKFMFPNKHSIYLHDTPDRGIFARANRAFSSGCIRVQRPADLARYLLQDQPEWTQESIESAMSLSHPKRVNLAKPVLIRITYSTVWVGEGGDLNFRQDVYNRDASVRDMLRGLQHAH